MVKKRVKKTVSKNKRGFGTKLKTYSLLIIPILLMVGFFVFMNVSQNATMTGYASEQSAGIGAKPQTTLQKVTAGLMSGNANEAMIRWVIFITLIFLIASVFWATKFPTSRVLAFILSIPIAYIAVTVMGSVEIMTLIQSYGALGYTAIVMLPLGVMLFFSAMLLQKPRSVGKIFIQFIAWWLFIGFSLYIFGKFISENAGFKTFGDLFDKGNLWADFLRTEGLAVSLIGISVLIPIFIVVFNKKFRIWIGNLGRELIDEIAEDKRAIQEGVQTATGLGEKKNK